jgi:hypothetical protein
VQLFLSIKRDPSWIFNIKEIENVGYFLSLEDQLQYNLENSLLHENILNLSLLLSNFDKSAINFNHMMQDLSKVAILDEDSENEEESTLEETLGIVKK